MKSTFKSKIVSRSHSIELPWEDFRELWFCDSHYDDEAWIELKAATDKIGGIEHLDYHALFGSHIEFSST